MKFIDEVKIYIKSGSGGPGAISFRREKWVPRGGPDGGDGGKGGSVIFEGDKNLTTLLDFKYISRYEAENGGKGETCNCAGKDAQDLIIKVPAGTLIKDIETAEVIADIDEDKKTFLILKGGRGGKGNFFFRSSTNRSPQYAQPGESGFEMDVKLELKLIAEVGIIGFPNVGKSTFISKVSAAKPKIADYPFTTLVPNLGVVKGMDKNFVIADIPGLIEGAHEGKGLGHKFLRHVERTKILLHLMDPYNKSAKEIISEYEIIRKELKAYSKELIKKDEIVALNKCDIKPDTKIISELKKYFISKRKVLNIISAVSGEGVKEILRLIEKSL